MTLDTNILIAYLSGEDLVVKFILDNTSRGKRFFISTITTTEILSLTTLTEQEIVRTKKFLSNFVSVPFDDTIAEAAAFLRRIHHISTPDAGVAATALLTRTPLVSRDRAFRKVTEIQLILI